MKLLFLICLTTFLLPITGHAQSESGGQGAGNGDGGWACYEKTTDGKLGALRWIQTMDLYENEKEWNRQNQKSKLPYERQAKAALGQIQKYLPDFYQAVSSEMETVLKIKDEVLHSIPVIEDSIVAIKPSNDECLGGIIKRVQFANYIDEKTLEIDLVLFHEKKLSETERSAIVLHEAIYSYFRKDKNSDPNSIRARTITGILLSVLDPSEKASGIRSILEHPEIMNRGEEKRTGSFTPTFSRPEKAFIQQFLQKISALNQTDSGPDSSTENFIRAYTQFFIDTGTTRARSDLEAQVRTVTSNLELISTKRLKDILEKLPSTTSFPTSGNYSCIRFLPFSIDLDPFGHWLGFILNGERPEMKIFSIPTVDWLQKFTLDLKVDFNSNFDEGSIKDGFFQSYHPAPAIDTLNQLKRIATDEYLGWSLHKSPQSSSYWDEDYITILLYCKKDP